MPAPAPSADAAPPAIPVLASREQALAWARAERTSLLTCLDQATAAGQHARVIALTAALAACCDTTARGTRPSPATPPQCRPPGSSATRPARPSPSATSGTRGGTGDYPGAAGPAGGAGHLPGPRRPARPGSPSPPRETPRAMAGDYPGAARDLQEALGICRDLGDRPGQADALIGWQATTADRGLSGRGPGPAGGAGHLPRPRRPARPGQRPHLPGGRGLDRGLSGRGPGPAGGAGHLPGPRRPARPGQRPDDSFGGSRPRPE